MITVIKNGYEVDISELGLTCISFTVDSLSPAHDIQSTEGVDGHTDIDTEYGGRNIYATFWVEAGSYDLFSDSRDAIYKLFRARDTLTLIDNRQPNKQWVVQSQSTFTIDNNLSPSNDVFDLTFISKSPYAIGKSATYTKDTEDNKFIVFNDGDIRLDGRQHSMLIAYKGESDKLRIRNNTNDTQWQYKGSTEGLDVITVDRVYPYKNDKNIFDDTNYGVIELNEGSNEIEVFGAIGEYKISFEFIPLYI